MQLEYSVIESGASHEREEEEEDLSEAMATLTSHSIAKAEKQQLRDKANKKTHRHKPVVLVGCKSERTDDR